MVTKEERNFCRTLLRFLSDANFADTMCFAEGISVNNNYLLYGEKPKRRTWKPHCLEAAKRLFVRFDTTVPPWHALFEEELARMSDFLAIFDEVDGVQPKGQK